MIGINNQGFKIVGLGEAEMPDRALKELVRDAVATVTAEDETTPAAAPIPGSPTPRPPSGYDALVARGVFPPVARFVTAERHPIPHFDIFVRPVDEGWDYNVPADAADVVGLWDENADAFARWTRGGQREFVHLYHDDPEHTVVAWTEQGLLAELARRYFEFLDWHDEAADRQRYEAFAEYIGFRHAAALETYLAVDSHTGDFFAEFRSLFGRLP